MDSSKSAIIWDVHGAVPEELEFLNNYSRSQHYVRIEECLARKASAVLCVTSAMQRHVIEKYKVSPNRCILLPIVPNISKIYSRDRRLSCFVYAGGTQQWQGISVMLEAIAQTPIEGQFYFFVPNPNDYELRGRLRALATPQKRMMIDTRSPVDISRELCSMGFGFCLRTDHIFNRVAFPTKLAEYVAAGVVPILSDADIGGFLSDGLRYVSLSKFIAGELPSDVERQSMADFNNGLLESWRSQMSFGAEALRQLLAGGTTSNCTARVFSKSTGN